MKRTCPRCLAGNLSSARYCARCGLDLGPDAEDAPRPGQIRHPNPLVVDDGFKPCSNAVDVYFQWESAWGGTVLLGIEALAVVLFNAGYPLCKIEIEVRGEQPAGTQVFVVQHALETLPRGETVRTEIPSYELPGPADTLTVSLLSAEYASAH
jgi:hypothetical protein